MRFLCVPCDRPMEFGQASPVDGGSSSLVFGCPDCGYEIAMMTNPQETRLMGSLGVDTGRDESKSSCPFTGMFESGADGAEASSAESVPWTAEAEQRMRHVPDLVKSMVRSGIERFARQKGYDQVSGRVLDEAKDFFEGAGFTL